MKNLKLSSGLRIKLDETTYVLAAVVRNTSIVTADNLSIISTEMANIHPDVIYMERCIELAQLAGRSTLTNPMVGALLVVNGHIIGEGYHKVYGGHHAEIDAINNVKEEDRHLIPQANLYVTLEPCSHFGKTPPCAHRIVQEGIKNVVIGCQDPNPLVRGNGIKYLSENGVNVLTNVLKDGTERLIGIFKANLSDRPYIILKWAQSSDIYISAKDTQTWLSNKYSSFLSHKWRSEADAILIGKTTAKTDHPKLNIRHYYGKNPIKILIDTNLEIDSQTPLYSDESNIYIINRLKNETNEHCHYIQVNDTRDLAKILPALYHKGINSIMVEGGAEMINSFLSQGFWDEARVIRTKKVLHEGIKAPIADGRLIQKLNLGNDEIIYIQNPKQ